MSSPAAVRARSWRQAHGLLATGLSVFSALSFLALLTPPAAAVSYTVNPVQVDLTAAVSSTLITISNQSSERVSFQVSGFRWTMDDAGESRLEPTEDLLFFPQLLEIEPKAERRLRVGATVPFGAVEGTYRLIVEELRPPQNASGSNVRILTRMSIPVFLAPQKPAPELRIAEARAAAGAVSFRVDNRGNVHAPPHKIVVTATSAAGETLFAQQLDGWYVLPGRFRPHEAVLPAEVCSQVAAVDIRVQAEGIDLQERLKPGAGACAPAANG